MEKLNKFEKEVNLLLNDSQNVSQVEKVNQLFNESVHELVESNLGPESEEAQRFSKSQKALSFLGRKILNLLTIEFKVTFAGATICYLRIPKLDSNDENDLQTNK